MYAIIEASGQQFKVSPGQEVVFDQISAEEGSSLKFNRVLAVSDGEQLRLGAPYVDGASVLGEVVGHERGIKLLVYKFKRRKNYRKRQGHRQALTRVRINEIKG